MIRRYPFPGMVLPVGRPDNYGEHDSRAPRKDGAEARS